MKKSTLINWAMVTVLAASMACSGPANKDHGAEEVKENDDITMAKTDFGKFNGKNVDLFTITNKNGVAVKITNYGGTIISLKTPDKEDKLEDVVLGFASLDGYRDDTYLQEGPYFGAIIGRYGNRIAGGKFTLDGQEYTLVTNNGPNHLHGGLTGFDKVVWEAEEFQSEEGAGIKLHYVSEDMEEGYPGALSIEVSYTLTNENELKIDYRATTDKKTVVNLTNHTYFNLTGNVERDILDHKVMIAADKFTPVDKTLIPTGDLKDVEGTPFDFTKPTAVGARINAENQQLAFGNGYDHNWVLGKKGQMKLAATVHEPTSGRLMEVFTTEPGVQFYTGNFLNGKLTGKENVAYEQRYGLCLETQHFPDSPNQPDFPSVVLNPDETYESTTVYQFSVK